MESELKKSYGHPFSPVFQRDRLWAGECLYDVVSTLKSKSPLGRAHPAYLTRLETLIRPTAATPDIILLEAEVPELFTIVLRYRHDPLTAEEISRRILVLLFLIPPLLRLVFLIPSLIIVPILIFTSNHRDETAMVTLSHRPGYMGFPGPLLVMHLRGRTSAVVRENCRRALNFQLSMAMYAVIPFPTAFAIIMIDTQTDVYVSIALEDGMFIVLFIYYWIHQTVAYFSTFSGVTQVKRKDYTRYALAIPFVSGSYRNLRR